MALLQKKLRFDLPYGNVYQGAGDIAPAERVLKYYQHGLYFDAKGDLLEDHPHNAEKIALLKAIDVDPDRAPALVQEPAQPTINPQVVEALADMSDEEVQGIAVNLTVKLAERGVDFGDFAPTVDDRDANVHFIAQYTS